MNKKILLATVMFFVSLTLFACQNTTQTQTVISTEFTTTETNNTTTQELYEYLPISVPDYVLEEERLSFKYFWEVVNGNPDSNGYGMISDRYNTVTKTYGAASIASVGYGLASIPVGIENDWISYEEGYERVLGTLKTLESMQRTHGFYYHFVDMEQEMR